MWGRRCYGVRFVSAGLQSCGIPVQEDPNDLMPVTRLRSLDSAASEAAAAVAEVTRNDVCNVVISVRGVGICKSEIRGMLVIRILGPRSLDYQLRGLPLLLQHSRKRGRGGEEEEKGRRTGSSSFHFLFHYPNITPIYYSTIVVSIFFSSSYRFDLKVMGQRRSDFSSAAEMHTASGWTWRKSSSRGDRVWYSGGASRMEFGQ